MMRDLSMHVMDIAQNSVRAGAGRVEVAIEEDEAADVLSMTFIDDGCGMSAATVERVMDPFYTSRTTRDIGLGLPLLSQTCQACGGGLSINSTEGVGTTVTATMSISGIDRPPLGDICETMRLFILSNEELTIVYRHTVNDQEFVCDTEEIKEALDGAPLNAPAVMAWLKEFIDEGVAKIHVSAGDN